MEEQLIWIGFLTIFIGIIIIFIGSFLAAFRLKQTKVEWGIGGFIGFIPIGFWSSRRMMYLVIIILIIFSILFIVIGRKLIL